MAKRGQNAVQELRLFPVTAGEDLDVAVKKYLEGEEAMANGDLELTAELRETNAKLDALIDVMGEQAGSRRRSRGRGRDREDEPESVRDMQDRGRQGEARQVAFEVKVPVGRQGGTLKGLLIFDVSVRDDRDLEDLANEVERKFRSANVFTKDFNRDGYRGGGGYNRPYYDRGGGYDRDRRY